MRRFSFCALAVLVLLPGCRRPTPIAPGPEAGAPVNAAEEPASPGSTPVATPKASVAANATPRPPAKSGPVPLELWKEFSGEKAMAEVQRQIEIGPRPSGTPEAGQARAIIAAALKQRGWRVEEQSFTDQTPRGPMQFVNLIARYGQAPAGAGTQAIVCSHYDTKRYSTIRFLGASDGASSTGALLELARVLALDPALAARIELVFFDGEEALQQFTETDGLYGSRYYAHALRENGRAGLFKFGILWDMIGDRDLTITLPPDSPAELAQGIFHAADLLNVRSHFSFHSRQVTDDHVPLNVVARIPSIDLIDFDYLYWHTADDTLDKLSPESLRIVGEVTTYYLKRTFPH